MSSSSSPPFHSIKYYRSLATRKGRREAGAFIVEGERAIRQIAGASPDAIVEILAVAGQKPIGRYRQHTLNRQQFESVASTQTPQGVLAVVRIPADIESPLPPEQTGDRLLLLEDIQDPGNVGTLIRTAAAFGFTGAVLSEKCADPFSPKVVQATAGSVLSLWLRRTQRYLETVNALKGRGFRLAAADLRGDEDTEVLGNTGKLILALGNEAAGLSTQALARADARVRLPVAAKKAESLNVAASGAVLMYLSRR